MQAWIFFYDMAELESRTRTKLLEELFGKIKQSHQGKYQHTINGKIPPGGYIRPVRATIIVQKEHFQAIKEYLDSYTIKHRSCRITVRKNDFEKNRFF